MSSEKITQQKKRKKRLLIGILFVAGMFLLVWILGMMFEERLNSEQDEKRNVIQEEYIWAGPFPEPDYDYNIFSDAKYINEFDRDVHVNQRGVITVISDENRTDYSREIQFMHNVINLIINGDYEEYNKIFTDEYIKTSGDSIREQFTMQQLYNIEIELVDQREAGGLIYSDIKATYYIRNNNGTFRTDLDFHATYTRPMVYVLVTENRGNRTIKVANLMRWRMYESGLF